MVLTDTEALKNGQTSEKVGNLKHHYNYTLANCNAKTDGINKTQKDKNNIACTT